MTRRTRRLVLVLFGAVGIVALSFLPALLEVPSPMWRDVFWRLPAPKPGWPRVLVIDLEREGAWPRPWRSVGRALVGVADVNVQVVAAAEIATAMVDPPRAIVLSGFLSGGPSPASAMPLVDLLLHTEVPVLGICGGHEWLGQAFGVRPTLAEEPEHGRFAIDLVEPVGREALIAGIRPRSTVFRWHRLYLAEPPPGFKVLARGPSGQIAAMRHHSKPLYGVQFHPEFDPAGDPRVLRNFLAIAGIPARRE